MPMKQVQGIMDEYDTDKSGEIDFDEFKDMMDGLKNKNKLSDDRIMVWFCRTGLTPESGTIEPDQTAVRNNEGWVMLSGKTTRVYVPE